MATCLLVLGRAGWGVLRLRVRRGRQGQGRVEAPVDAATSELGEKNAQLEQAGEEHTRPLE